MSVERWWAVCWEDSEGRRCTRFVTAATPVCALDDALSDEHSSATEEAEWFGVREFDPPDRSEDAVGRITDADIARATEVARELGLFDKAEAPAGALTRGDHRA